MAYIARRERSRSPVDMAGSSNSSGILRTLDMKKMQLSLEGRVAKVVYFKDDDIWFEAKPMVMYLEYSSTHVTQTLGIVKEKNKKSLKELLDSRGPPKWGDLSDRSPPGYNDLKALYINEPGLYSLIFRSTKKQAQDFQDWVYEDVLTELRRHGSYKIGGSDQANALRTWLDGDLQIVLKKRDDELQLALQKRDDALMGLLQPLPGLVGVITSLPHNLAMSVRGCVRDVIDAAVTSADSKLVKVFRAATKLPPRRKTTNAAEMPEAQHASSLEAGPLALGLSTVALEVFPELPFTVWKSVRGPFGQHAKRERQRLHDLGERHPEYVAKPLLWGHTGPTVEGGGLRYIYLQSQRVLMTSVFKKQRVTSAAQRAAGAPSPTESLEQRSRRLALGLSDAERAVPWPEHVAELEPQWDEA